jgi:hypothetical protein
VMASFTLAQCINHPCYRSRESDPLYYMAADGLASGIIDLGGCSGGAKVTQLGRMSFDLCAGPIEHNTGEGWAMIENPPRT